MFLECEKHMDSLEIESEDEGNLSGGDDVLQEAFSLPYSLESEVAVSTQRTYILHIDGNSDNVAIALSDQTCAVYDIYKLKKLQTLHGHKGPVSNIKFSPADKNLVYSSSYDGTIKLWDIRENNKVVKEFKDDTEGPDKLKPLTDFDVSYNERFVSAGTELVDDDAFVLFWDVRSTKLLGGYWESHMDDVTQVKFHPEKQDILATGSTDGLMNVFDISESSEDDALLQSLNTESSVEKIHWFSYSDNVDALACITHTQDLQLWDTDGATAFLHFDREAVSKAMQRKLSDDCFIVDIHNTQTHGEILLLTASTAGRGECLRSLSLPVQKKKLKPVSNFVGNKQIVRASWHDKNNEVLVTGGESGILSLWKRGLKQEKSPSSNLKVDSKQKLKHHQKKPY